MPKTALPHFPTMKSLFVLGLFAASIHLFAQPTKGLQRTASAQIADGTVPEVKSDGLNIAISNGVFTDATGRTLFLRGINLGGSTKVPYSPNMASHVKEGFFDGKDISFVGRPFPVEEADEHFKRLKAWGFHFVRFLVTWEAIEHQGPGIYDTDYLDYVHTIIAKAGEYGINVMIDPHQDVWSRYTGGDGAPLWTFEVAGMDVTKFQETGAAFVHNVYGDPFPQMIWYTNYYKLGAATMFTLFFGGNDFAPETKAEGQPIQDYLQEHYINALARLAEQVKDLPNVVGFELMNEPSAGYIGIENLSEPYQTDLLGDAPTPYQGMLLGNGIPQNVPNYRLGIAALKETGVKTLNPDKVSAWKDHKPGIWAQNGVWKLDENGNPQLTDPSYFAKVNGQKVDFNKQYYEPFIEKYVAKIGAINPDWFICVDNVLYPYPHELPRLKDNDKVKWVNGSHWYDDMTLVKKKYIPFLGLDDGNVVFGKKKVRKAFENRLSLLVDETQKQYGNALSLLGEFGIPYDMNKAKAYKTGNYKKQIKALNRSYEVIEANRLNYTQWNYTADNTNQRGDSWNGEDLSVFSHMQQIAPKDINSGGRALEAAIRPYPKKIAGQLKSYQYDYKTKTLTISFEQDNKTAYPTEIFVPEYVYGNNFVVYTDGGKLAFDKKERILMFSADSTGIHQLIIKTN